MYINGCTLNVLCWAKFYSNWSLATVKLIWYKKMDRNKNKNQRESFTKFTHHHSNNGRTPK